MLNLFMSINSYVYRIMGLLPVFRCRYTACFCLTSIHMLMVLIFFLVQCCRAKHETKHLGCRGKRGYFSIKCDKSGLHPVKTPASCRAGVCELDIHGEIRVFETGHPLISWFTSQIHLLLTDRFCSPGARAAQHNAVLCRLIVISRLSWLESEPQDFLSHKCSEPSIPSTGDLDDGLRWDIAFGQLIMVHLKWFSWEIVSSRAYWDDWSISPGHASQ